MPIYKSTYSDQVVAFVYDIILKGRLSPGDRISEKWLSDTLGISRAPIREALRQLAKDGLVTYRPQVGNFIAALSSKQIYDTYVTRGVLEGFAAGCAVASFTEKDFEKMERYVARMVEAAEQKQHFLLASTDNKLHEFIFNKSNNRQLIEFSQTLSMMLHLVFCRHWTKVYQPEQIKARHQLILDQIRSGDTLKIETCIRNHYIETGRMMAHYGSDTVQG